ncbi:MAG: hypothetical protein LIP11_15385 [Clostridiales bacterium]|nr:hypothetical protein [Clostridiales bacterium]
MGRSRKRRNKHLESETKPKKDPFAIPSIHFDLGEGYYFTMEERNNGVGGYATVTIGMYKGEELIRQISDRTGTFLEFPGVEHGAWEDELRFPFQEAARFVVRFRKFGEDGLAEIFWTVRSVMRNWLYTHWRELFFHWESGLPVMAGRPQPFWRDAFRSYFRFLLFRV